MSDIIFQYIADPFSSLSHIGGALVCGLFTPALLRRVPKKRRESLYLLVFALSAIVLLSASGIYHLLPHGTEARALFQRMDHAAIFVLIAGTCTACHGLFFEGFWREPMIAILWIVGLAGMTFKLVFFNSVSEAWGLVMYLSMGWLGLVAIAKLAQTRRFRATSYIIAGGVVYTAGAVGEFLAPSPGGLTQGGFSAHDAFHVAVLGGIFIHWKLFHEVAGKASRQETLEADTTPTVSF